MPHPYGFEASQLSLPGRCRGPPQRRRGQERPVPRGEPRPRWAPPACSGSPCPPSWAASARDRAPSAWPPRSWRGPAPRPRWSTSCTSSAPQAIARLDDARRPRRDPARGRRRGEHLTTLALSEKGSRSQFWAPVSKLAAQGDGFVTSATKSWVTSADSPTRTSRARRRRARSRRSSRRSTSRARRRRRSVRRAPSTAWGCAATTRRRCSLEGLPVRGGDLISEQGEGADTMLEVILPWFAIGTAAMANGLCRAAVDATAAAPLRDRVRAHRHAAARPAAAARAAGADERAHRAVPRAARPHAGRDGAGRAETPLFVLSARRAALEAALEVTDLAMKACGGAAFSRHHARRAPVPRRARRLGDGADRRPLDDFVGKALTGLPLF